MREGRCALNEPASPAQLRLLNAACGDLADAINWHGARMSKDDWRHLITATVIGSRPVRGICTGEGSTGIVMLGRSSLELTKAKASEAITLAFSIGDDPASQDLKAPPIRWGLAVTRLKNLVDGES